MTRLPPLGRALLALFLVLVLGAVFNPGGVFFRVGTHLDLLGSISVVGFVLVALQSSTAASSRPSGRRR